MNGRGVDEKELTAGVAGVWVGDGDVIRGRGDERVDVTGFCDT
jgi:hypothetical protein